MVNLFDTEIGALPADRNLLSAKQRGTNMRIMRSIIAVLVVLVCSAFAATAQTWYVQSADWGSGNRRQDVTNTVRRLVSGGSFKANNQNLGVDPAVGADKTLRIIGRDRSGAVRTFTYKEGATVNSSMFSGSQWGGGGWNGGGGNYTLRIMQANYGATNGRGNRNVTQRLQGMVRNNRIDMTVTNQSMGGDPAVGQPKQLYVQYEYGGRRNNTTVPEGGRLTIP
jgi:hypothetical protein